MQAAEAAAFEHGSTPESLMDQAAAGIAAAVSKFFRRPGRCVVFSGKGNNGGDALAAAALLYQAGWHIDLQLAFEENQLGDLPRKKLAALEQIRAVQPSVVRATAGAHLSALVILDGLL